MGVKCKVKDSGRWGVARFFRTPGNGCLEKINSSSKQQEDLLQGDTKSNHENSQFRNPEILEVVQGTVGLHANAIADSRVLLCFKESNV